jgi:Icc-related predicted phosphoesterase
MKSFVRHSHDAAERLRAALASVQSADCRVALTHSAPVEDTLRGERLEIFPFMGSYHLAEAIDSAGADLAVHGHAHGGTEKGATPGGVPVRNVAQPVIRSAYRVYCVGRDGAEACA